MKGLNMGIIRRLKTLISFTLIIIALPTAWIYCWLFGATEQANKAAKDMLNSIRKIK